MSPDVDVPDHFVGDPVRLRMDADVPSSGVQITW